MNRYICFLIFSALAVNGMAQSAKQNRFIPFVIGDSTSINYNDINPVLTPDEKTLFFSRINHPDNHFGAIESQDVWYCHKLEGDKWSTPERVKAAFNNGRYNAIYAVTNDWEFLVSGIYAKNGRLKKRGLSLVKYDSTLSKWLNPVKVKVPKYGNKNKGLASSAFIDKSGKVLVLSYAPQWQVENTKDVRFSIKKDNGKWRSPKPIKNKTVDDLFKSIESPFLSDDGTTLYVSAYLKGKKNVYQNDIYKMERLDGTYQKWSDPELLSDTINTDDWENYYKQFDDGNWAVFARAAVGKNSDIYMVKLNEPYPYIDLSGLVLLEGEPMQEDFQIVINGEVVDSVRIDVDSSRYAVQLPFGSKYEIQARAVEREAKVEIIDATDQLEYLKMERDLQLSLLPFLDLSGIVQVGLLPLTEPFQIIINGVAVDSVRTDFTSGEYSVKLPLGQSYKVYAQSGYYIADTAFVDVSFEAKEVQMRQNLALTPTPYVDIYGRLVNIKTDELLPQEASPKFVLNGVVADSIDTRTGNYKIRLPWGKKYTFQVQADEFDPVVATVDLQGVTNYQKIERNLYASPLEKYALVTGKVIDKKTGLPFKGEFLIDVDGSHSTSCKVDSTNGSYEIRLSLGKKSILTASANAYFPIAEVVDVTQETSNVQITKDLLIVPLRVGEAILLNTITFETASSTLKGDSFSDMDRVIDLLKAFPNLKIEIGGHTDSSGNDALNLRLSKSRAESVTEYILGHGISKDRVVFKGYGETKPVASNLTPGGRAQNRRVEFVVLEL